MRACVLRHRPRDTPFLAMCATISRAWSRDPRHAISDSLHYSKTDRPVRVAKALTPLQGIAILTGEPEARVLFCSCLNAMGGAASVLRPYVAVACEGKPERTDFTPLKGRMVDIWAPGGAEGAEWAAAVAARIVGIAERVRVVDNSEWHEGRDLNHIAAEGWTEDQTLKWASAHIKVVEAPAPKAIATKAAKQATDAPPKSALELWQRCGWNNGQIPYANESTAAILLAEAFKGKIWFDTFRSRIFHSFDGTPLPWDNSQTHRLLSWFQTTANLPKMSEGRAWIGVCMVARENQRNSVTEWLETLQWDNNPRLDHWVVDYLGCPNDAHHTAVGRNWLISMVARAYEAGCKVDHMPVLEGLMGRGKSTALKILADPWYVEAPQDFGGKQFIEVIQGQWLAEIPDMTGFSKSEHTKILATITIRSDAFRIPWDRLAEQHPRRTLFAATSETSDYLKDARGIRRYWPLRCQSIDLESLAENRNQLFAEALVCYKAGASWHETPASTRDEQLERVDADIWTERVAAYVVGKTEVTSAEVFERGVDICVDSFGQTAQKYSRVPGHGEKIRVANILRAIGWYPTQIRRNGARVDLWRRLPTEQSQDPPTN